MPSLHLSEWKYEYTVILFIGGIFANLVIALLNGVLGFLNQSAWQGTLCAYYTALMLIKLVLLFGSSREGNSTGRLWRWYLYVSVAIVILVLVLGGIVYLMATDQGSKHYPGFLIYGVAYYAFCKIISALVSLIKAGKRKAPVRMAMKSIGFVDAMVSILMLEIALIDTFGTLNSPWARMMMAASGSGVWLIAMAVGIYGVWIYKRRVSR